MKKFIKKIITLLLIFIPLIIAVLVYGYIFTESPQKLQASFQKYFIKHLEELESFNISPYNKILEISLEKIKEKHGENLAEIFNVNNCTLQRVIEAEINDEIKLADRYMIMVNEKEFVTEITNIINELLIDEKALSVFENIFTEEDIENFKESFEKYAKTIDNIDENAQLSISVCIRERKPVRTDFISEKWEISYQISNKKDESFGKFSIQQNQKEVTKFVVKLSNKVTETLGELTCEYEVLYKTQDDHYAEFNRKENDKFVIVSELFNENEYIAANLRNLVDHFKKDTVPTTANPAELETDEKD